MGDRSPAKHVPLTDSSSLAVDRVCTRALVASDEGLASIQQVVELSVSAEMPLDSGARIYAAQHGEHGFMQSVPERSA